MISRRAFLTGSVTLLAAPLAAEGQQAGKIPRVGFLGPTTVGAASHLLEAFRDGLRELGYVEGRNVVIDYRWADGQFDRLPALAAELVALSVDVIVAPTPPAVRAAKNATTTIPIVMLNVADPMGTGLVADLSRPGGNVTGQTNDAQDSARNSLDSRRRSPRVPAAWRS